MKIYLIRHGRQCSKLCNVNVDLSQEGFRQAALVGERLVKKNIDFDVLLHTYSREQDLVEEIYQLILETVQTEKDMIRIAGEYYPAGFVKGKLLKPNYSHIEYVLECMDKNTTKVRNIKQYLLAALFNAPSTIGSYYKAEVNHDMPQYAN